MFFLIGKILLIKLIIDDTSKFMKTQIDDGKVLNK